MQSPPLAQELVATTSVSGKPILVMRGQPSPFMVLDVLRIHGEQLDPVSSKKGMDPWKVRSLLGFSGQSLQLISSFLRPTKRLDTSIFVFAATNLAANTINMIYDHGQLVDDPHQLHFLKQRINRELAPHLRAGEAPIAIEEKRAPLRESDEPRAPLDTAKVFLKRHSVAVGELGLRYLGAIGLAFPARWWKEIPKAGLWAKRDPSTYRVYSGLSSVLGKTVALSAQIPDPYNPKPETWIDHIRERWSFLAGGLIEVTSFSALAYSCFFKTSHNNYNQGIEVFGRRYPDILGGVGATLFVLGYIVRSWAKFGERKVDMNELYAHASDTLAATPPEKLPELLANTSASLSEHFDHSDDLSFSIIYSNLLSDLTRYHAAVIRPARATKTTEPPPLSPSPSQTGMPDIAAPTHRIQSAGAQRLATLHPEPLKTLAS